MAQNANADNPAIADASAKYDTLTFLIAPRSVSKILRKVDGTWTKYGSDFRAKHWTVKPEKVRTLDDVFRRMKLAAARPEVCFIHGTLKPGLKLVGSRRHGDLFDDVPRRFVLLDLDALDDSIPLDPIRAAEAARALLPAEFQAARCIWNTTAGHGIPDSKTGEIKARLRLVFWTDRPVNLTETIAWLGECAAKPDRSVWRRVQPIYLGVTVEGVDPVQSRWGMLDGDAAVAVPAELHVTAKAIVERTLTLPPNVVPNDPDEVRKFVTILATRDADRIVAAGGRRLTWMDAANDGFDRALSDDLILSILVTWFEHDDGTQRELADALKDVGCDDAVAIAAQVCAMGDALETADAWAGDPLDSSDVERMVGDALRSRRSPIGSKYGEELPFKSGGTDGSEFPPVDDDDDDDSIAVRTEDLPDDIGTHVDALDQAAVLHTHEYADPYMISAIRTLKTSLANAPPAIRNRTDRIASDIRDGKVSRIVDLRTMFGLPTYSPEPYGTDNSYSFGTPVAFTGMRLADTVDVEFLAYPQYPIGVVGGIIGHGGANKSGRSLVEALGVVTGRHDLVGVDNPADLKRASAWVHNGEDSHDHITQRLAAAQQHFKIDDATLNGAEGFRLFVTSSANARWIVAGPTEKGKIAISEKAVADAVKFIKANNVKLAIFDPVIELHNAAENSNEDMAKVYAAFRKIAINGQCHVLVVVHAGKPDKANADGLVANMHGARGASSQTGSMRFVRTLTTMSKPDALTYGIPEERRLRYARLDDAKANHSPQRSTPFWFESVSVSPGPGRHTVLVSAPVALVKGRQPATNDKAEAVAGCLRSPPFGVGKPHVLVDVIEASGLGASWGKRSGWSVYFRREVLGSAKGTECLVKNGKLLMRTTPGAPATIALLLGEGDDFMAVEDDPAEPSV